MAKGLDLVDGIKPGAVLADRAYDADRLMDAHPRCQRRAGHPAKTSSETPARLRQGTLQRAQPDRTIF